MPYSGFTLYEDVCFQPAEAPVVNPNRLFRVVYDYLLKVFSGLAYS